METQSQLTNRMCGMRKTFTLEELACMTQAELFGDPLYSVSDVSSLEAACSSDISFLSNPRYKEWLERTQAGVVCIDKHTQPIAGKNFLISDNPSKTFQCITDALLASSQSGFTAIHPSAVLHHSVRYAPDVTIGPHTTIDQGVVIGEGTKIHANVSIGPEVTIGKRCILHPGVVVRERCVLHDRVILQPGAVIGSCGFGYITDSKGCHHKIEQLGNVILEDDVEIGANTTIDRARFQNTTISKGTKIDNLVQIGHNVFLGEHNIVVSQTGISGSARTGKHVVFGGQAGVVGHVEIADHTQIATRGGVTKSIKTGGPYGGSPLQPFHEFNKHRVYIRNIEKYVKRIEELEKQIEELKKFHSPS